MLAPQEIGKYKIISMLGGGAFGDVYHAFDRALQVEKAIKVLRSADPKTFGASLKEAQVLAGCIHKHIVQINEANILTVSGSPRVVLDFEYVPEGSLEDAIKTRWISCRDAVYCVRGALLGLEFAHSQGFLHRDIKPGNILLAPNVPKLSDFGLATFVGQATYGSAKGYLPHLPPEYYANQTTSDQTDVFAAGVTLFRVVCNIQDWRGTLTPITNLQQHIERGEILKKIGYPRYVPRRLKRVINKACAPDPVKRFESAASLGAKLDSLRFDIDWTRLSVTEWDGVSDEGAFSLSVSPKNEMVVKKNGRRVNKLCQQCSSSGAASMAAEDHVARTTLA